MRVPFHFTYSWETEMSSQTEVAFSSSLRRCSVAIILSTSIWWACANAFAQQAAPAPSQPTVQASPWSLEGYGSNTAPHLVMSMLEPEDTPSSGFFRFPRYEAALPAPRSALSLPAGPAVSLAPREKGASAPVLLSSLLPLSPAAGARGVTDFGVIPGARQAIQRSTKLTAARSYSLLGGRSETESFLYQYQANYSPPHQGLVGSLSITHRVEQNPLFHFDFGSWEPLL